LYHLREHDFELFSRFLQQCFMHFYTSQRWFYCVVLMSKKRCFSHYLTH
jgi:hypothetical protein